MSTATADNPRVIPPTIVHITEERFSLVVALTVQRVDIYTWHNFTFPFAKIGVMKLNAHMMPIVRSFMGSIQEIPRRFVGVGAVVRLIFTDTHLVIESGGATPLGVEASKQFLEHLSPNLEMLSSLAERAYAVFTRDLTFTVEEHPGRAFAYNQSRRSASVSASASASASEKQRQETKTREPVLLVLFLFLTLALALTLL